MISDHGFWPRPPPVLYCSARHKCRNAAMCPHAVAHGYLGGCLTGCFYGSVCTDDASLRARGRIISSEESRRRVQKYWKNALKVDKGG